MFAQQLFLLITCALFTFACTSANANPLPPPEVSRELAIYGSTKPVMHVSLVEVAKEEKETYTLVENSGIEQEKIRQLSTGTYVTFESNVAVVIQKIEYGELDATYGNNKQFSMSLPITVNFTHGEDKLCVTATLTEKDLPTEDNKDVKKVKKMKECGS